MLVKPNDKTISTEKTKTLADLEVKELLALGQQQGWEFTLLGRAPLPDKPVHLGDWLIVPAVEDTSEIPTRALERVKTIFASGLRPKGFVLVHEAPNLLTNPEQDKPKKFNLDAIPQPDKSQVIGIIGAVVSVLAVISTLVVSALATLTATTGLIVIAAVVDPILVAVTEDDYWIEIDRWWN